MWGAGELTPRKGKLSDRVMSVEGVLVRAYIVVMAHHD